MQSDPALALEAQFRAMQDAHAADPAPGHALRKDRLDRLEAALERHADALVAAMMQDFGHRSPEEAATYDVTLPLADIRSNRRHLRRWMRPRRHGVPLHLWPARGRVMPQPKGVVGVIAPWNFPVYLAIAPLAAALAAGNRVMIKPSELTPRTSEALRDMIAESFAPEEVSVALGGAELSAAFAALPFGHLLFTGSTEVGRKVAAAAAPNLTPVTLELGGTSPAVIGTRADIGRAARRIAFGKLANAGQVCVAPDYVLVPRAQLRAFTEALGEAIRALYPEPGRNDDYTAIISPRHAERLREMRAEAEALGVEVIALGADGPEGSRKLAPVLLVDPPEDIRAMREEIFGPLLPILPYDTPEAALEFVAARPAPLALYIFTEDGTERGLWLSRSLSGGACVNETTLHVATEMPFGGVGASGMGAYHGRAGFETFSHLKAVLHQPRLNFAGLLDPPRGPVKKRLTALLRKIV